MTCKKMDETSLNNENKLKSQCEAIIRIAGILLLIQSLLSISYTIFLARYIFRYGSFYENLWTLCNIISWGMAAVSGIGLLQLRGWAFSLFYKSIPLAIFGRRFLVPLPPDLHFSSLTMFYFVLFGVNSIFAFLLWRVQGNWLRLNGQPESTNNIAFPEPPVIDMKMDSKEITAQKINALGFPWPHPSVPAKYIVSDDKGLVDLEKSIQSLKKQIYSDEKILSDAFSFRSDYGGQMSTLDYSDYKDSYDDNRERLNECKQALGVLETIYKKIIR